MIAARQIPRAGRRRTVALPLRTWVALDGSLRNFTGKTHEEDTASPSSFTSFGVSFRALSGASSDASEEVSVSRFRRCLKLAQATEKKELRMEAI